MPIFGFITPVNTSKHKLNFPQDKKGWGNSAMLCRLGLKFRATCKV